MLLMDEVRFLSQFFKNKNDEDIHHLLAALPIVSHAHVQWLQPWIK